MVKKKGPALTEAQQLAADRVQSLRSAVFTGGLFAPAKPTEYPKLAPSNALVTVSGQDIFRRSSQRKGKYLFSFPGRIASLASSAGATLGLLEGLDTPHPTLRLDVEAGSFLLRGVILPVRHKLLTLQLHPRAVHGDALASASNPAIVCEDVFDKVVVFSEAVWLGDRAGTMNPGDVPQALPPGVLLPRAPSGAGAGYAPGCGQPYAAPAAAGSAAAASGDAGDAESGGGRGARARRAVRYTEAAEDDDDYDVSTAGAGGAAYAAPVAPSAGVVESVVHGAEVEVIVARRGGAAAAPRPSREALSMSAAAAAPARRLPPSSASAASVSLASQRSSSAAEAPSKRKGGASSSAVPPSPALDIPKSLRPAPIPLGLGWGGLSGGAVSAAPQRSVWASPPDTAAGTALPVAADDDWLFSEEPSAPAAAAAPRGRVGVTAAAMPGSASSAGAGSKRARPKAVIDLSDDEEEEEEEKSVGDEGDDDDDGFGAHPSQSSGTRRNPKGRSHAAASGGDRGIKSVRRSSSAKKPAAGARGKSRVVAEDSGDGDDDEDDESVAELDSDSDDCGGNSDSSFGA